MKISTNAFIDPMVSSIAGLLVLLFLQAGCQMKVMQPTSEDQVRERVASLEEDNRKLEDANSGLKARIAELTRGQSPDVQVAGEATPRLADLLIASSSSIDARAPASNPTRLVLRLAPRDDRGRFLQIVGALEVRVVSIPDSGAPVQLADVRFDPLAVREAWRGGVMGSGYVFDVPLDGTLSGLPPTVDVVTIFTQAGSGRVIRDESPVKVSGDDRS